ncbi:transcription factor bHLH110-like isoform X3 [Arachis ipaensis]|uniref:transcription factor bHLH110-like isoform X3 n=1 Tax=Arachis ipaensis TaxID=130454 RepID=UPI0007AFCD0B|nr:transcription factor bHLH110-like isoform X3 [Arachis ipaensis]XP_025668848.1 transcription factor bHLH110 isoform X2 [Arachis hypogaea]
MESPNLHQHPSSSSSSSSYGSTTHHSWTPNITFHIQEDNNNNINIGVPLIQDHHHHLWTTTTTTTSSGDDNTAQPSCLSLNTTNHITINHNMLNSHHTPPPPSSTVEFSTHDDDKLLLKTFFSAQDFYSNTDTTTTTTFCGVPSSSRRNFSHIYPTINISNNINNHSSPSPSSSSNNMTSHSFDLPAFMTTTTHGGGAAAHQQVDLGLATFSDNHLSFHLDHHHSQHHRPTHASSPPCSNSTTSTTANNNSHPSQYFSNGTVDTKRPCTSIMDTKASQSLTASKKSRSESRPSCPPFKVRKEKLGDRIAALQQLVAPFDRHSIRTYGSNRIHKIPSKPSRDTERSIHEANTEPNQLQNDARGFNHRRRKWGTKARPSKSRPLSGAIIMHVLHSR